MKYMCANAMNAWDTVHRSKGFEVANFLNLNGLLNPELIVVPISIQGCLPFKSAFFNQPCFDTVASVNATLCNLQIEEISIHAG